MQNIIIHVLDFLLAPITFLSAILLKLIRRVGLDKTPMSRSIFLKVGVLPVQDHYYEPLINPSKYLEHSLQKDRLLTGIDMNDQKQLNLLKSFDYNEELKLFPEEETSDLAYYYNNSSFKCGDSEYLYNMIRHFKPLKIVEIGSGNSTLMARNAVVKNKAEDTNYVCEHICIEPYEKDWLEKMDIKLVRKKVESIDLGFFKQLMPNDILFIDSSHIIRPQGDVLYEYLSILPVLKPGVIIHIHDIFTPKDYLKSWVYDKILLWNEQYLLEALLTNTDSYEIIGALNYLLYKYPEQLKSKCPILASQTNRVPGSFWMKKI